MKISEHIYGQMNISYNPKDFSSMEVLEEFFAPLAHMDEEQWPLYSPNPKIRVGYSKAKVHSDNFGFGSFIDIVANVKVDHSEFTIVENISIDDSLKIKIDSIIRSGSGSSEGFVFDFIERHRQLLKNFDQVHDNNQGYDRSEITLSASSNPRGKPITNGGYVWATHGFDFATDSERLSLQKAFQIFAAQHKVIIENKDLKLFTKPCHFAAFQCGVKVADKNLGKAFLLQNSWFGKMAVSTSGAHPEEYRYAQAYHFNRGNGNHVQKAALELNKKFLRMMKKYHNRYAKADKESSVGLSQLGKKIFALSQVFKR